MRKAVKMKLGGKAYSLLPTFAVAEAFEERFYGLLDHLERLMAGKASIHARAFLVQQGLIATDDSIEWDHSTVMERLFERGYWDESQVLLECEFIERLLYTPKQYTEKKALRASEATELEAALAAAGEPPNSLP